MRCPLLALCLALMVSAPSRADPTDDLFDAISEGKELVAEGIIVQGRARPDARNAELETPLHRAVEKGMKGLVEVLIKAGASTRARSRNGETPLHLAALHVDTWFVAQLLAAGSDP